jgi:hypothetical protein
MDWGNVTLPAVVTGIVILLGAIITGVFTIINRRGTTKAAREPSWVELANENRQLRTDLDNTRIEFSKFRSDVDSWRSEMNDKLDAFKNVLDAINHQTPVDFHPVLNTNDIKILEDTLPASWRGSKPPAK